MYNYIYILQHFGMRFAFKNVESTFKCPLNEGENCYVRAKKCVRCPEKKGVLRLFYIKQLYSRLAGTSFLSTYLSVR